jgi:hypothetical protein
VCRQHSFGLMTSRGPRTSTLVANCSRGARRNDHDEAVVIGQPLSLVQRFRQRSCEPNAAQYAFMCMPA